MPKDVLSYGDVIMSAMAYLVTGVKIFYPTVCSMLRVKGLCEGNSTMTGEFPAKGPGTRKIFQQVLCTKLDIIFLKSGWLWIHFRWTDDSIWNGLRIIVGYHDTSISTSHFTGSAPGFTVIAEHVIGMGKKTSESFEKRHIPELNAC